ncbi:MAG: hypothetical protein ACJAQ6_000092 [Arenicella sp.]|jgi:hypothetical protein
MKTLSLKSLLISSAALLIAVSAAQSVASDRQTVRFYKINKDGITQALRFTAKKARKTGCHNFIRKARLHRVVQYQYKTCRVFADKSCQTESIMSFYRDKEPAPTTDLIEGFGWYPVGDNERGEKAKSWFCE